MMVRLVKCINVASIGSDSKVVVEAPLVDTVKALVVVILEGWSVGLQCWQHNNNCIFMVTIAGDSSNWVVCG